MRTSTCFASVFAWFYFIFHSLMVQVANNRLQIFCAKWKPWIWWLWPEMSLFISPLPSKHFSAGGNAHPTKWPALQMSCECDCLRIRHFNLKFIRSLYNARHNKQVILSHEMKRLDQSVHVMPTILPPQCQKCFEEKTGSSEALFCGFYALRHATSKA